LSALFNLVLVGEMAFSCQFLEFWIQGSDSKSKAVVKTFVCHRVTELDLYQVYIWRRRLAAHRRNQGRGQEDHAPKISSISCHFVL